MISKTELRHLEETLARLRSSFTAADLLTPVDELVTAVDDEGARRAIDTHDYDVIPKVEAGRIVGGWSRIGGFRFHEVDLDRVVAGSTGLLDMVSILARTPWVFVLRSDLVDGYVHFSDLNRSVVKLPVFALFEAVESRAVSAIDEIGVDVDRLAQACSGGGQANRKGRQRAQKQFEKLAKMRGDDVAHHGVPPLFFHEYLRYWSQFGGAALDEAEIGGLNRFRTRVAHADKPLVMNHAEVRSLDQALATASRLLGRSGIGR